MKEVLSIILFIFWIGISYGLGLAIDDVFNIEKVAVSSFLIFLGGLGLFAKVTEWFENKSKIRTKRLLREKTKMLSYNLLCAYKEALKTPGIDYKVDFVNFMISWIRANRIVSKNKEIELILALRAHLWFYGLDDSLQQKIEPLITTYMSRTEGVFDGASVKTGIDEGFNFYNKKNPENRFYLNDHLYYIMNNTDKDEHIKAYKKRHPHRDLEELICNIRDNKAKDKN